MTFLCENRIAQDGTPRSAASHLGLNCLPMSHKKVNHEINPYMTNGFSHHYHSGESTFIVRSVRSVFFIFYLIFR